MVLSPDGAVLLLIDLQERLMPVIADHEVVVARAVRLAEAATLLDVPVRATEQNPAGLGPTVPPLSGYPQAVLAKTTFSAAGDPGFAALSFTSYSIFILCRQAMIRPSHHHLPLCPPV